MACSHTADLAEELGRDVRVILDADAYRTVFPNSGLERSRKGRDRGDLFDTVGGGVYKAAGVRGPIGGRGFTTASSTTRSRTARTPTRRPTASGSGAGSPRPSTAASTRAPAS
jgi:hypothetical protein